MMLRTHARLPARWPTALARASRSSPASDAWVPSWNAFFDELQLQEDLDRGGADKASNARSGALPAPLLRSIAQHWVDQTLLTVASARLAEVYPPARANILRGVCEAAESPLSSLSSPVAPLGGLELLLATWSAHMLLAVLHTPHQASAAASSHRIQSCRYTAPGTVSTALADCLEKDVAPVLHYLTTFATPPIPTPVIHHHHHHRLCAPTHALRHALVLLLASFVTTWGEAPHNKTPSSTRVSTLTRQERALALELCRCIAAFNGDDTAVESILRREHRGDLSAQAHSRGARAEATGLPTTSLEAVTEAQFALVKAALSDMLTPEDHSDGSVASTPVHARDAEAGNGPLWKACKVWIADALDQQKQQQQQHRASSDTKPRVPRSAFVTAAGAGAVSPSSPFAGITGVHREEEEAVDVLDRVNDQLNQVARSSTVNINV
ncbi:hypothetical protein LPMP_261310 [Leishmania panamensis]|uniref:Uncharacterized protein n=1 Tax=Leishmania panamensis TaxID=5679 RepID=A0A088RVG9_LEIPA|nr:hypothetical protein LPMP_261310 [Leishmania panamensis]AIN99244.1 hypothetical protein LPMP_261310 [Leishmania panamensis]